VRTIESDNGVLISDNGVLIIDDSITEKPSTDESPLICWHYDHAKDRMVKGVNFISALYHSNDVSLPVGVHLVIKSDYEAHLTQHMKMRTASKNSASLKL
jgi:hypothetical protein